MHLFFSQKIQPDEALLLEEEAAHCMQVLRHAVGDPVRLTDGAGHFYLATITGVSKKQVTLAIRGAPQLQSPRPYHLHLAIAPTKNIERFEWLLEKSTELGIDRITPLICEHSERSNLRADRLSRILVSAMKQSSSAYLPALDAPVPFQKFLQQDFSGCQSLIGYCGAKLPGINGILRKQEKYMVLVGPEGDFSEREYQLAVKQGFAGVSLGSSRLRTETAGLYACAAVKFLNDLA